MCLYLETLSTDLISDILIWYCNSERISPLSGGVGSMSSMLANHWEIPLVPLLMHNSKHNLLTFFNLWTTEKRSINPPASDINSTFIWSPILVSFTSSQRLQPKSSQLPDYYSTLLTLFFNFHHFMIYCQHRRVIDLPKKKLLGWNMGSQYGVSHNVVY